MYRLFRLSLNLDVSDINEVSLRELVEQALNSACHFLESNTRHEDISYKIKEIVDLD